MISVSEIVSFLSAYPEEFIAEALAVRASRSELERDAMNDGWIPFDEHEQSGDIPSGHDWRILHGKRQIRPSDSGRKASAVDVGLKDARSDSEGILCPFCGETAYRQAVCPNCAKGKAGLKSMFICGNDADHVFYTE